jgi:uncharacterized membrane protein YhaH (DUF805 family)
MPSLSLLFGVQRRVTRKLYLVWGLLLAVLKFAVDAGIVFAATGKVWSPIAYVVPSLVLRGRDMHGQHFTGTDSMHVALVVAALPFLWVGLSMSVRRAADAGKSPWLGMLFVLPLINYLMILALCFLPSKNEEQTSPSTPDSPYRRDETPKSTSGTETLPVDVRGVLFGIGASMAIGLSMLGLCVYGLGAYGTALFFVTPFAMGATTAAIVNARAPRTLGATIAIAIGGIVLTGLATLLFAVEGVLCLAMALPICGLLAMIGAVLGWGIMQLARPKHVYSQALPLLLLLPALGIGERTLAQPTLRHVTTSIEVEAPPEDVWPNVIGFSDLPPPPEWFFQLGVAYPKRARILGSGVGAVRHCEFSTGPFVEPITVWNPPSHLAFDVTSQPPSMTELSPYRDIKAPHLEGYMTSKGGEFRLVRLPGNRTRIEGTTHYTLAIYPETYWVVYAEMLLHAIHRRVLGHIKTLSEKERVETARIE